MLLERLNILSVSVELRFLTFLGALNLLVLEMASRKPKLSAETKTFKNEPGNRI